MLNKICLILALWYPFLESTNLFAIPTKEKSMSKKVLFILMPKDYRDEEFYEPFEIIKKAGYKVDVAGFGKGIATGAGGYKQTVNFALKDLTDADFNKYEALVIPGGPGSTKYLWNNKEKLHDVIRYFHNHGKIVAAICYACIAIAQTGILKDKDATVYPTEEAIKIFNDFGVKFKGEGIVTLSEEKIITAQGPKQAKDFGNSIVELLKK